MNIYVDHNGVQYDKLTVASFYGLRKDGSYLLLIITREPRIWLTGFPTSDHRGFPTTLATPLDAALVGLNYSRLKKL